MSKTTEVDVTSELLKKAKEMEARALANKPKACPTTEVSTEPMPSEYSLNLYPDDHLANVNLLLRGPLFGVIAKRQREAGLPVLEVVKPTSKALKNPKPKPVQPRLFLNEAVIPSPSKSHRITFTGEVLDQADRDVYELLIHLCKTQPLGTTCVFSAHEFIQLLGRNVNYAWLEIVFKRLIKALIFMYELNEDGTEKKLFGGHLIDSLKKNTQTKKWSIRLGPELYDFYTKGTGFSHYPLEHRRALKGLPLASWLQGYFCTHTKPVPVALDLLKLYSGSTNKSPDGFKQLVNAACKKLQSLGIFESFGWIGAGATSKLYVVRQLNKSQAAWLKRQNLQIAE
jgi:hypothetical protein